MTSKQLQGEITEVWVSLGKDPDKLNFKGKSKEELKDGLTKMKAVKMGFELLLNDSGASNLAIHLLANVFGDAGGE